MWYGETLEADVGATIESFLSGCDWSTPEEVLPADHRARHRQQHQPSSRPRRWARPYDDRARTSEGEGQLGYRVHLSPFVRPAEAPARRRRATGAAGDQEHGYKAMDDKAVADLVGSKNRLPRRRRQAMGEPEEYGFLFKTIGARRPEQWSNRAISVRRSADVRRS